VSETKNDGAQNLVAYKNNNTDHVYVFDTENADLEARSNFRRVELSEVPQGALDAALRAKAERDAIEGSATIRARRVEVRGEEAAAAMGARATGAEPNGSIVTTGNHLTPDGETPGAGILSRPGIRDTQIGPDPDRHPRGLEALEAQARYDTDNPSNAGVLSRPQAHGAQVAQDGAKVGKGAASADEVLGTEALADAEHAGKGEGTTVDAGATVDDPADKTPAKKTARKAASKAADAE
jgi:hypothetical protein